MKSRKNTKLREWQKKASEGGECMTCSKHVDTLTVDHIVPITILDMLDETGDMKYNYDHNFQLLCPPCNAFKANRLDRLNPKTRDVLSVLIDFIG